LLSAIGSRPAHAANPAVYIFLPDSSTLSTQLTQDLLSSVTTQFNGQLIPSLVAGQYIFRPMSENPAIPPVTGNQILQELNNFAVETATQTFVPGFADGMNYQQQMEEGLVGSYGNVCSSSTHFDLVQTTTKTFDQFTCMDVISTIVNGLFEQSLSTPTIIPPEP
jgi:hypothetical protein